MDKGLFIITGANGGMGKAITRAIAGTGVPVIMACRNVERAAEVRDEIVRETGNGRVELHRLDLASVASIRSFVDGLNGREVRVLVNNAGIMCRDFSTTEDGVETTVGVNYMGTWLLTNWLLPNMGRSGRSRIINTSSVTCKMGKVGDHFFALDPEHYRRFKAYPDSKLAILMFTTELARRLQGRAITVNAVDPGVVNTGMITMHRWYDPLADIFFRPFIKSPERGAMTAILLATSDRYANVSGGFFKSKRQVGLPQSALDVEACRKLWSQTEQFVAELVRSKLKKGENEGR
ncbi:SDR family oxidoreductase [Butyricimonas faecalis]|uniref:SDR family oxidoreductase n=1 Tax=Butyricimonas faecalis TaxID=2093856 RepID=UPI001E28DF31|nr:SDR family oxidoreductase [Butyricimonas faecalis]